MRETTFVHKNPEDFTSMSKGIQVFAFERGLIQHVDWKPVKYDFCKALGGVSDNPERDCCFHQLLSLESEFARKTSALQQPMHHEVTNVFSSRNRIMNNTQLIVRAVIASRIAVHTETDPGRTLRLMYPPPFWTLFCLKKTFVGSGCRKDSAMRRGADLEEALLLSLLENIDRAEDCPQT